MAWHRSGDKPLSEPMMISLPTHIGVTRPQWVNISWCYTSQGWFRICTQTMNPRDDFVYAPRQWIPGMISYMHPDNESQGWFRICTQTMNPRDDFVYAPRQWIPGMISYMHPDNERWRYRVTSSLIGWVHTQNDPWYFQFAYRTTIIKDQHWSEKQTTKDSQEDHRDLLGEKQWQDIKCVVLQLLQFLDSLLTSMPKFLFTSLKLYWSEM